MGDMTIRPEDVPVVVDELTETDVLANTPTAGGERDLRITDSTLRDGSHAMSHQFTEEQVRGVVHALDSAGVQVIEVSHGDGLGGSSFNYGFSKVDEMKLIAAAVDEATQAKIAILMLPGLGTVHDLKNAHAAGASVARIATHCTEADVSIQHFGAARALGMETVGFLMLSHKAAPAKLAEQARIMVDAGAQCVYVVDSAGALVLSDAQERITAVHRRDRPRGAGRLPRPPEPQPRHRQLGARLPGRCAADRRRAVRPGRRRRQQPHRGARRDLRADGHPHRRRPRRGALGRRGRRAPVHPAPAVDGPRVDHPGLRRRLLQLPAARRARRRALRRAGPRDPDQGRRVRLRRRPGGHDHRHRPAARRGEAHLVELGDLAGMGVR